VTLAGIVVSTSYFPFSHSSLQRYLGFADKIVERDGLGTDPSVAALWQSNQVAGQPAATSAERSLAKGLITMQVTGNSSVRVGTSSWELKSGGGCLSLFGLPFLLAGLFVMQIPLGLIPVHSEQGSFSWLFAVLFGGVFASVGAALVFGRWGVTIDRGMGKVIEWWGLPAPLKVREYPLSDYQQVLLSKQVGDSDSPTRYPVTLAGGSFSKTLQLQSPASYGEARRAAEDLAQFLSLALEDSSAGVSVTRPPDLLRESLRDRVRRGGQSMEPLPMPPVGMKTKIQAEAGGVLLEIPSPRQGRLALLPAAVVSIGFFLFAIFFLFPLLGSLGKHLFPPAGIAIVVLFFLVGPLFALLRFVRKSACPLTRVWVSPALVRIEAPMARKKTVTEMSGAEIEEVLRPTITSQLQNLELPNQRGKVFADGAGQWRLPDGRPAPKLLQWVLQQNGTAGITIKSSQAMASFGQGLSEEELIYLQALIEKTLTT
jgi:hypothetical protein